MDTDALKVSWQRVAGLGDDAAETFYAVLFATAPHLRAMFPPSMAVQRGRLLSALGHIVSNVDDPVLLSDFAAQLGRDHRKYDVLGQHYALVGQALLETLRRALGPLWTTALAADWAAAYHVVADLMISAADADSQRTPPWWSAQVLEVDRRAPEITVITVRVDGDLRYLAGQSLTIETALRPRVWRFMSPANPPRPDGIIEFHVRAVPGGLLSPALTYDLQRGDLIKVGPPVGTMLCDYRHVDRDLLLLAGGTGLAPLRAIVEELAIAPIPHRVTFVVGSTTMTGLYDLDRLRVLHENLPWLTIIPAVASDARWSGPHGSAVDVALRYGSWADHEVYVCGPPDMVSGSRKRLVASGVPARQIHWEDYSNYQYAPASTRGAAQG